MSINRSGYFVMFRTTPCKVYWRPLHKKCGPRRVISTSAALASDRVTDQMRIAHLTRPFVAHVLTVLEVVLGSA